VSPDLVPRKATNILLRLFCWTKIKNYLLACTASTTWEIFASNAVLVMWRQQSRR
jgi:hypothetical protein